MVYIRLMNMGATIRTIAEALDINPTTAFYWRHKILNALKDGKSDAVLEEHTQADETFTYLSTKGNKNAYNNLHPVSPFLGSLITRVSGNPDIDMVGDRAAAQED